jgi:glyoxylase-like metal-dependent hydrolase (beta-lactamase superfamily II)
MEAYALAPDLWRWTGRRADPDIEVGCLYYKTGREILLFDPLLPSEDPEGFWRALDRDVLPIEADVHVLLTRPTHTRSAREMLERYPNAHLWTSVATRDAVAEHAGVVTDTFEAGETLPGNVSAVAAGRPDEVLFWIPEHRALVVGDALMGNGEGGLRLHREELRESLMPLLDLEIDFVLASHGEPVRGDAELRALLAG